jgi:hypothetical protein
MQGQAWAALLRHVPAEQHGKLMLVTTGKTEIAIQSILRIDREFLAVKGRLAGSQDQGRLFFIPFGNIDYFGFQQAVKDEEYQALFGDLQIPTAPQASAPAATVPPEPMALPAELEVSELVEESPPDLSDVSPSSPALPQVPVTMRTPLPIKSAVLERFRARIRNGSGG